MKESFNSLLKWQLLEEELAQATAIKQQFEILCACAVDEFACNACWCLVVDDKQVDIAHVAMRQSSSSIPFLKTYIEKQSFTLQLLEHCGGGEKPFLFEDDKLKTLAPAQHILIDHIVSSTGRQIVLGLHCDFCAEESKVIYKTLYKALSNHVLLASHPLLDKLEEAVLIIQNNRIKYINAAVSKLSGYNAADGLNRNFYEFLCPEEIEKVKRFHRARLEHRDAPTKYNTKLQTKGGDVFDVELNVQAINYHDVDSFQVTIKDLRSYKAQLEALKESEEYYRRLAEESFDGILIHRNGIIIEANKAFARMLNMNLSEVIGIHIEELLAENDDVSKYRNHVENNESEPYTLKGIRKNSDKPLYVEIDSKQINFKGELMRIPTVRDISDRVINLGKLSNSIEELYLAQEMGKTGTWKYDMDAKTFEMSPYTQQMMGYASTCIDIDQVSDRLDPDERYFLIEQFKSLVYADNKEFNAKIKIKDGDTKGWLIIEMYCTANKKERSIRGIIKDITIEEKQKDEIRKFKAISDAADYGSLVVTPQGKIIYVNAYYAMVHGYTPDELIGKPLSVCHSPEQMKEVAQIIQKSTDKNNLSIEELGHVDKEESKLVKKMNMTVTSNSKGERK